MVRVKFSVTFSVRMVIVINIDKVIALVSVFFIITGIDLVIAIVID